MVHKLDIQGNVPKTYFPTSWLSDKSVFCLCWLSAWRNGEWEGSWSCEGHEEGEPEGVAQLEETHDRALAFGGLKYRCFPGAPK